MLNQEKLKRVKNKAVVRHLPLRPFAMLVTLACLERQPKRLAMTEKFISLL